MSKMFKSITRTWNPVTGCNFACPYCWARRLAEGRLKRYYPMGFVPEIHTERFNEQFKQGETIFVCSMGDIAWASVNVLLQLLGRIKQFPKTDFLLCSKNPSIFWHGGFHEPNIILGTTIETNRDMPLLGSALVRSGRFEVMSHLPHHRRFVSIEPILDFDVGELVRWVRTISPEIVEVGADSLHNNLTEPPWIKVDMLLESLRGFVPTVIEKDGLGRLKR